MLEKDIEAHLRDKVKDADGIAFKFTSPSRRSVPDRLVLMPIASEEHTALVRLLRFKIKLTLTDPTLLVLIDEALAPYSMEKPA